MFICHLEKDQEFVLVKMPIECFNQLFVIFFLYFVGLRFGLMQTKIGLIKLIQNYEFSVSKITKPVVLSPYSFITTTVDPIYLNAKKIH